MKRVTVILSDDEYTQVRTKAGAVPLSRWFRDLALTEYIELKAEFTDRASITAPELAEQLPSPSESRSEPSLAHHTAASNRFTCMCESCVNWRQRNDIQREEA
jgi:hypothetical protein